MKHYKIKPGINSFQMVCEWCKPELTISDVHSINPSETLHFVTLVREQQSMVVDEDHQIYLVKCDPKDASHILMEMYETSHELTGVGYIWHPAKKELRQTVVKTRFRDVWIGQCANCKETTEQRDEWGEPETRTYYPGQHLEHRRITKELEEQRLAIIEKRGGRPMEISEGRRWEDRHEDYTKGWYR